MAVVVVTDDSFDADVLKNTKPTLVDFWAEWCGPCRMVAPVVAEVAESMQEQVKVCKLDVDNNRDTPMRYAIRGIPTLILFAEGKEKARHVGALNRATLEQFIREHTA